MGLKTLQSSHVTWPNTSWSSHSRQMRLHGYDCGLEASIWFHLLYGNMRVLLSTWCPRTSLWGHQDSTALWSLAGAKLAEPRNRTKDRRCRERTRRTQKQCFAGKKQQKLNVSHRLKLYLCNVSNTKYAVIYLNCWENQPYIYLYLN